jgi:hypothetical protein
MAIAILAGKTSTERNKIIAAGVLGVISLLALYFAFGSSLVGGSSATRVTVKTSPTPKAATTPAAGPIAALPSQQEQQFANETTPVVYNPGNVYAPDAGRNIFAFYEPPIPCKDCPPPTPRPTEMKPATPAPTPPMYLAMVNPQTAYAGSQGFRIELSGDRFAPDARIYFNQVEMPTTFLSPQRLAADIPAGMIAQEGPRQVIVQTPDGKLYSDQSIFNVQAPPKPTFQYVGMIARARGNNDTGVFERQGKPGNFSHRLNDVVDQQFRLISVSRDEAVFEDVNLGFKHRLPISKAVASSGPARPPTRGGSDSGFVPFDPNSIPQTNIPGIPNNIPRYVPPQTVQQQQEQRKKELQQESVDDKGDD